MEHSSLEDDYLSRAEIIHCFAADVAPFVLDGQITDDTKSPTNNLSGLEQVIMFEVGPYLDEEFNIPFVKAAILVALGYLKKDNLHLDSPLEEEEP